MNQVVETYTKAKADYEQAVKDVIKPAAPRPRNAVEDAKQSMLVARAEVRKQILAPLERARAEAAREYIHAATAFVEKFYDLLAQDQLISNLTGSAPLMVGTLSGKLAIPAPPEPLCPHGWTPQDGWGMQWVPGAVGNNHQAQGEAVLARSFVLEEKLRRDLAGLWPFGREA